MQHKKDKLSIKDISQLVASLVFVASIIAMFFIMGSLEQDIIGFATFFICALPTLLLMFISMLVAGLTQDDERRKKYDRK